MNKRVFFIILAVLCVTAAVVFVLVGAKRTAQPSVKEGLVSLGAIRLTFDEDRTREELKAREKALQTVSEDPEEQAQNDLYTVIYSYIHPQYGLIEYDYAVDTKKEYDDLLTDRRPFVYEGDVFREPDETDEAFRDNSKTVYVYAWPKTEEESRKAAGEGNSLYNFKFSDSIRDLYDISEEIEPTPKVSSTYYYIVSGILLLGGAYLLFLGLTSGQAARQRTTEPQQTRYAARQGTQKRTFAAQSTQQGKSAAIRQGEWTCKSCGAKNAFGQPRCRLCGTPKQTTPEKSGK